MSVLSGYRVLDFGRYVAGPYCATLMADFGAEVIRVEKLSGSEDRYVGPVAEDGSGSIFLPTGRNKKSITLNPMKPEGRAVVRKLVQTADVVVANMPLKGLQAMGLDYETLREIKPDIILTMVSAYGSTGPYAEQVGFDGLGQTMSGSAFLSGEPGAPVKTVAPWVDFGAAMMAAYGTALALLHRKKTGQGQVVEGSLLHTAMAMMNAYMIESVVTGVPRQGTGNRHPLYGPADIVPTRNGHIMVQVVGNPIFERWAKLIGQPDLAEDPRFSTDEMRGENGAALSQLAREHAANLTTEEALAMYRDASVPAGPVNRIEELLQDPHVLATGLLQQVRYGSKQTPLPLVKAPIELSAAPSAIKSPPPVLGQDTDEVLGSLGLSSDEIEALRGKRVV